MQLRDKYIISLPIFSDNELVSYISQEEVSGCGFVSIENIYA